MEKFRWQIKVVALLMVFALMTQAQAQPADKTMLETATSVIKTMRDEKISAEKAWEDGLITKEILLYALNQNDLLDPGRGLWLPGSETREWTTLLRDKFPELWKAPPELSNFIQIRIALFLNSERDPRGARIMEHVLDTMSREHPDMDVVISTIYNLSGHYQRIGENDKALKTSLRIQDFTTEPTTLANLMLGAARATYAAGDVAGARKLYDQVESYKYGWAIGHAHSDWANHLFRDGKLEEGRALLKEPIEGLNADQYRVVLNGQLADSYFSTGEWDLAREYAKATVDQYNSLANPIPNHGLEYYPENAKRMSERIEQWKKSPVQLSPSQINLRLEKDATGPIHTSFTVSSYRSITVKATSTDPDITIRPLLSPHGYESREYQMLDIEIGAAALAKNEKSEIVLTFQEFPELTLRIPLTLRKDEPK